jgi:hypothetical protein
MYKLLLSTCIASDCCYVSDAQLEGKAQYKIILPGAFALLCNPLRNGQNPTIKKPEVAFNNPFREVTANGKPIVNEHVDQALQNHPLTLFYFQKANSKRQMLHATHQTITFRPPIYTPSPSSIRRIRPRNRRQLRLPLIPIRQQLLLIIQQLLPRLHRILRIRR